MIIDLSFIPQPQLPYTLKELIGREIKNPFQDFSNPDLSDSAIIKISAERALYFKLRTSLIEFAEKQFMEKNFSLSDNCFRYLAEVSQAVQSRG